MKIRLFNVKFSPNLGDGLLSECLENALREKGADAAGTFSVDLGARTEYAGGSANRGRLLSILHATPTPLRLGAMRLLLRYFAKTRWEPHYREKLRGAEAMIIGGGNLFTDMDLNFSTKLSSALLLGAQSRLPTAIYGVGVSKEWSTQGLSMMRRALSKSDLRYVSVRDEASRESFNRLFSESAKRDAKVVRDPGIMISRYVKPKPVKATPRRIGVCITSAIALTYHSQVQITDDALRTWYQKLFAQLLVADCKIVAFTNGSPEDIQFLDQMMSRSEPMAGNRLEVVNVRHPNDLAALIAGFSFLVAHRMHALIAAFSYGVPFFALEWDPKVNAFVDSVGLGSYVLPAIDDTYEIVAKAALQASGREVDETPIVNAAFDAIDDLLSALRR